MTAKAYDMTLANNNYFIKTIYLKKTPIKVGHPNMMAYYLGAHTR